MTEIHEPSDQAERGTSPQQVSPGSRRRGWPLWLRIALAAVVLSFVWSPFLAMLLRLSRVSPALQPTGSPPDLDVSPRARPRPPGAPAAGQ